MERFFYDTQRDQYLLVDNGMKRPIQGENIQRQYKDIPKVLVDFEPDPVECTLEKKFGNAYKCTMDISGIGSGAEYQFTFFPSQSGELDDMDLILVRGMNISSLNVFLTDIKNRLIKRLGIYGQK